MPKVTDTDEPACADPVNVTPAACSAPLIAPSPPAVSVAMLTSLTVSITTVSVIVLALPKLSVATIVRSDVYSPGPNVPSGQVTVQLPSTSTVVVWLCVPTVTTRLAPASPVPEMVAPLSSSSPLNVSPVDPFPLVIAISGGVVSIVKVGPTRSAVVPSSCVTTTTVG